VPSKIYSHSLILLFSFLALVLIGICAVEAAYSEALPPKAENKIIIGDDHSYPPYAFLDENGQPSGFNIDLSKALASEMGIRIEIRLESWSKVKTDLESGHIDAISGMFNMPERRFFFDFSTRHNISAYTLFVRADSGIKKAGDAKNREIIVEKSDIGHDWALANDFSKKIIPVPSITEALTLLAAGKHDAVLVGRMQGYYITEKFKLQDLVAVEDNLFEMDYCFAVKKGNADLLDKLNTGLQILKSSGKYNEIYDKWFAVYETDNFILKAKSYLWLFKWAILFLVFVFGGMWAWNFSLRRAVNTKIRNLNESEQRFKSIFEFSYDAMSVWDQEFRCAFVNSSAIDLFKIKEKIPSGADISSCFRHIPELGTILKGKIYSAFQTGQPIKSEDHFEVDGNLIFTESVFSPIRHYNSEVYAVVVICRDTTARKIAEARLAKSEAVFSKMVQNASDIFVIIKPDGVIRYVSPAIETITGFYPEELRKSILSITHPDDISIVEKAWKECIGNPLNAVKVEFRHAHKNGGFVHLEAIGQSFIDDPDINGVIATARSVEERKTEEDKRIEMERQLLHTQKLESLGVLAGGIAHDFNNLLMAIMGYAELCSYEISAGSMASSHMNEILKASQRAAELCQQLLAYTGKGRFIIERINVDDVIRDMIPLLETCISKKANIALNLEANLPEMEADASQIRQIIMNLIINASEAIGDRNGLISISARKVSGGEIPSESVFFSTVNPKSEYINLEISDNGCGMNQDTLSKIFEPFFTTKFTGRGLGMAAVQGIVKGHCGAILIQSEPEVGTVFNLYFPASLSGLASISGSDQEMEEDETGIPRGKILLVDDEEIIRKVGTGMLEKLGFQVLTAQDGQEALSVYRGSKDEIACIILDLTMPVMDGEEAYNEFLKIDPDVRVIVASGYSETEISSMFSGKGLVRFIQKPFKVDALKRIIHRALE